MNKKKRFLYAGFDDSNHLGQTEGEVIVGIFSTKREDRLNQRFPKRRDHQKVKELLQKSWRDFRFTIILEEELKRTPYNLPLVMPFLLEDYLSSIREKAYPSELTLGFDGELKEREKLILERDLKPIETANIFNFTGKTKRHCPLPVYMADVHANYLFRTLTVERALSHRKYVPISSRELLERKKLFE